MAAGTARVTADALRNHRNEPRIGRGAPGASSRRAFKGVAAAMLSEWMTGLQGASWAWYEQMDESRRWQGRMLEAMGYGPVRQRSRTALTMPGLTLKAYGAAAPSDLACRQAGPALVLVPAPIKRAYIWDLAPEASVVRRCVEAGIRVYLVEWKDPPDAGEGYGLADYGNRLLLACVRAVEADTGQRQVFLAGHSLGGTLSAIFSSLHPQRVKGLALIASPLHFDFRQKTGALGPLIGALARWRLLSSARANVPGSFLSTLSFTASPSTFGRERWSDWLDSLSERDALDTHLRVERWTLDEMPLAKRFIEEVVERLYREDGLMHGMRLGAGLAAPQRVEAPLITVADARCRIVPPEAILPFHEAARSNDKRLLWYEGDTGVAIQHVGVLVGRSAQQSMWPEILRWIRARHEAD